MRLHRLAKEGDARPPRAKSAGPIRVMGMKKPLLAALGMVMFVSACGTIRDSRLNPFNWFGGPTETVVVAEDADPLDPRPLVAQITDLKIEPIPDGALVRATGLPPTQGWWDAELVEGEISAEGVLTYEFRLRAPLQPTAVGTPRARQIIVAAPISHSKLAGVRAITVQGASNALTSRR